MRFSHSKLSCALNNPMDYYLSYKMGIYPKIKNKAFTIGSAMHWGLENDTEDLTQYFKEENPDEIYSYSNEQFQAEAMVHGFMVHKKSIMNEIFKDEDGNSLEKISEWHELPIEAKLPSFTHPNEPYEFNGIIDLLFLTNKGFIIIDYKSSSQIPEWNKYLDQIYRYNYMLNQVYPDIPVYKTGIINIVKSYIRKKSNENDDEYRIRYWKQYEEENTRLINVHMFESSVLDKQTVNDYILNLSRQADIADSMDRNNMYYIDYSSANGENNHYKSVYLSIYNHTPYNWVEYSIKDTILDQNNKIVDIRDCIELDMKVIEPGKVLNKFDLFLKEYQESKLSKKQEFFDYLKKNYKVDDWLLENYWNTMQHLKK